MKQLTVQIKIGSYTFYSVDSIAIASSWKFLADTATITLSRRLLTQGSLSNVDAPDISSVIKVGDAVSIQLGYDFIFEEEFTGHVKAISPNIPVKIECEDAMWLLKQTNYSNAWREVSLNELLKYIMPSDLKFQTPGEINLGKFRIDGVSTFDILNEVQKVYGLVSYFRDKKLIVGFPYQEQSEEIELHLQKNVDDSRSKLFFRRSDQVKLKIKAISIQPDGSKVEVEIGDQDGQLRTLHVPVGLSESETKKVAEEKRQLYTFDGYEGSLTTFGQPYIRHSDNVNIMDDLYKDREGVYRVDTVEVKVGSGGYRRTLTLGNKVN